MGTRAFGDASQQARKNGAGVGEQIGYGLGVGATELLTEKMFDGLGGIYGRGMADDAVNGLIGRLAKTPSGRDTLHALASMGSEAAEEIAAGVIEPAFESIYNGRNVRENYGAGTAADTLHDAMIGGFLGLLGGTVGKHIRSDLADVQTRYDATLRALADPSATAEQRARLAQSTADMADWASRRLDELAPANARQAATETQRALADIAERMKPLTLDEAGEPIIDPLGLTDSEWTSGWKADKISENTMWHSVADPMAEITGAGELSNPEEIASFRKEIQKFGVELMEHEGESLGYAPSLQPGKPGQLLISRGASYSAWCHEMQHMRDDMAAGWTGMRILSDVDECYRREQRAYAVEIALAKKMGRTDMVKRLEDNLEKERRRLYGVRE